MKLAAAFAGLCAVAPAQGFVSTPALKAPAAGTQLRMQSDRSIAIPFDKKPEGLDGSLVGDVGFDPAGFSNNPPRDWLIGGKTRSLKFYREAELQHGRVAQLAALGWIFPEIAHWPGNKILGEDVFATTNPWEAWSHVPVAGQWQIALTIYALEVARMNRTIRGDCPAGDSGLGQGEGRWNPFGFNYTPEEYEEKQLQEIKHCRLAMIGVLGMAFQSGQTGTGVLEQLSHAFTFPDAVSKAGYYFPDGI